MLALDPLLRALHDDSERVRDVAAQGLGGVGPPAVPGLIQALEDPDRRMRLRVIKTLGIMRPISKETISAMIKSLGDPDGEVRNQAVQNVQAMGPEATPAIRPLLAFLRRGDQNGRQQAARALAAIGKPAVPSLIEVLRKEDDPSLRIGCFRPGGAGTTDRADRHARSDRGVTRQGRESPQLRGHHPGGASPGNRQGVTGLARDARERSTSRNGD